jgi:ACT domain-containing protein
MGYTFQKIDAERQRDKMSITELMKKLGLSRATYYEWRKNDGNIAV